MKRSITINPESGPVHVTVDTDQGSNDIRFGNSFTLSQLDGADFLALQSLINAAVASTPYVDYQLSQNAYAGLVKGRHTPALRSFIRAMPIPVARALNAAVRALEDEISAAKKQPWRR